MLTQEQIDLRRKGITATDMTKIAGVSPYGGAIDVVLDKRGESPPFVVTDRVKWGNILEVPIRQDYVDRHRVSVAIPGTLVHPEHEWAMATPDGIIINDVEVPQYGWECKTHTVWLAKDYGEPGSDDIPQYELIQCIWNMYVARAHYKKDITRWDLTAFIDNQPTDYTIHRDAELEGMLVAMAKEFKERHIDAGEEIEPDGSDSYSEYIKRVFSEHRPGMVVANEETKEDILRLRALRETTKGLENQTKIYKQKIQLAIGDLEGVSWTIDGEQDKITWRKSRSGIKVDFEALARAYRNEALSFAKKNLDSLKLEEYRGHLADMERAATKEKPGSRRFVTPRSWTK